MQNKKPTVLVAAGGTGGHLFPALAVVEQLEKLTDNNIRIIFVGTENRIESEKIPAMGYEYHPMPIRGFSGLSLKLIKQPYNLVKSFFIARSIIRDKNIDATLCAGAYISLPPGFASSWSDKPLFLMEANVNPGKTIRWLASRSDCIFSSYKETSDYFDGKLKEKLRYYGNPVRGFLNNLPDKRKAIESFNLDPEKKTLLIFGGSLGARSINKAVEAALPEIAQRDFQVIWQTGKLYKHPAAVPPNVKMMVFIDDMASAYAAADLVLSRSGATTAAELAITSKPSILVPLQSATNGEQEVNAEVMEKYKAALMVDDSEISYKFMPLVDSLINNAEKLNRMGAEAGKLAKPDAAENCAKDILRHLQISYK